MFWLYSHAIQNGVISHEDALDSIFETLMEQHPHPPAIGARIDPAIGLGGYLPSPAAAARYMRIRMGVAELFEALKTGHIMTLNSRIPRTARVHHVSYSEKSACFELLIEDASFAPVSQLNSMTSGGLGQQPSLTGSQIGALINSVNSTGQQAIALSGNNIILSQPSLTPAPANVQTLLTAGGSTQINHPGEPAELVTHGPH